MIKVRDILIFCFLISNVVCLHSQGIVLDSLYRSGTNHKSKAVLLEELKDYHASAPLQSLQAGLSLLKYAQDYKLSPQETNDVHFHIAYTLANTLNFAEAHEYILKSYDPEDPISVAHLQLINAVIAINSDLHETEYLNLLNTEETYRKYNHPNILITLNCLGIYHHYQHNYDLAKKYYLDASHYAKRTNQQAQYFKILMNISSLMRVHHGEHIKSNPDYEHIHTLLDEALQYFEQHNNYDYATNVLTNKIEILLNPPAELSRAKQLMAECESFVKKVEDHKKSHYHYKIAKLYMHSLINDNNRALYHVQQALTPPIENDINTITALLRMRDKLYLWQGDYDKFKNSFVNSNKKIQQFNEDILYESRAAKHVQNQILKTQTETKLLSTKNKFLSTTNTIKSAILLIIVALTIYLLILYISDRKKTKTIENINQTLSDQMETLLLQKKSLHQAKTQWQNHLDVNNKLLDRLKHFSAHIINDFKTPIINVHDAICQIDKLLPRANNIKQEEYTDFLLDGSKRLRRLMGVLKKHNNNTLALLNNFENVDLNEIIKRVQEDLSPLIEKKHAQIITDSALPTLFGHPDLMLQLFENLITNSLLYTVPQRPPIIHIRGYVNDLRYCIDIEDNGMGMSKDQVEKVLTLFRKNEKAQEDTNKGFGLALSSEIVDIHEGQLRIDSILGSGTKITISFDQRVINLKAIDNKSTQTPMSASV